MGHKQINAHRVIVTMYTRVTVGCWHIHAQGTCIYIMCIFDMAFLVGIFDMAFWVGIFDMAFWLVFLIWRFGWYF